MWKRILLILTLGAAGGAADAAADINIADPLINVLVATAVTAAAAAINTKKKELTEREKQDKAIDEKIKEMDNDKDN